VSVQNFEYRHHSVSRKASWDEHFNGRSVCGSFFHEAKSQVGSAFQKIECFSDNQEKPDSSGFPAATSVENIPHFNESAILGF